MGDWWGVGEKEAHLASCATSGDSQAQASSWPEKSEGEWWVPSGQAAPPSLLFTTAMLFVMVPLERTVSRIFNTKWAKIWRFLPIQWIDFLLWSVQGPIISVYLCLMGVYKTIHIIWALWMCMTVTASLFMWVMWVHVIVFGPKRLCPQITLIHGVLFDRSRLQAVGSLAQHYANKSCLVWQWSTCVFTLFKPHIHKTKENTDFNPVSLQGYNKSLSNRT